ncbi:TD and POZ domain-containing protein 3 [Trichonephila inaurata madagascariensis]|uniref:TD and POZ domain-containing protein 3 n=1 Tax=Trichonephila inaurata madagascariensis TaxID=2747483 RepID=A0A8X6XPZ0_9ARAC|nr:TD and POZ domain-containing protein 3 [Trichonephila inaurata madagascariensis]
MEYCSTCEKKCFSFTWAIENFSFFWQKKGENILSPTFIADTIERSKWKLALYPDGCMSARNNSISFFLRREVDSKGPTNLNIFFELSFLAVDGSVVMSSGIFECSFDRGKSGGFSEFMKKESLGFHKQQSLPEDILTARCRMWKKFGQITEERQCFARTRIGVERRSFVWTIPEFSSYGKRVFDIKSILDDKRVMTLNLSLERGNLFLEHAFFPDLQVFLVDKTLKCSIFHFHLLDVFGNRLEYLKQKIIFTEHNELVYPSFISVEELIHNKDYLPNDVLTLHCKCSFTAGIVSEEIEKICQGCPLMQEENLACEDLESNASLDLTILQENLESLYKENFLCDTKLMTKTKSFLAHKCILSARSPVFKAMFNNDMRERSSECVNIEDLDEDTVQRMLLYLYTATLPDLQWDSACNLYTASDKYEILSLKNECSSFLKDNLSPDNVCNLLILADMHQDKDLKSSAEEFILNRKEIFDTCEWKLFMKTNLQLAADLMHLKLIAQVRFLCLLFEINGFSLCKRYF